MVMRAGSGVLNTAADELNEKNGSSSVEEGLDLQWIFRSCLDVESYPVEHNSSVEAESSSIW